MAPLYYTANLLTIPTSIGYTPVYGILGNKIWMNETLWQQVHLKPNYLPIDMVLYPETPGSSKDWFERMITFDKLRRT